MMIIISSVQRNLTSISKKKSSLSKKKSNFDFDNQIISQSINKTIPSTKKDDNNELLSLYYNHDRDYVNSFAFKTFNLLKTLQLAILSNRITTNLLENLKYILNNYSSSCIQEKKYLELFNEIKLRLEVEVAKIESAIK